MKSLQLSSGHQIPALGLGTWKADPGQVGEAVKHAIRLGYRHIDCAAIYGNEAEIGIALAELFAAGEIKREELWITSKLWNNCHAPEHVLPAIQKTLSDLRLEQVDLYLMHWPLAFRHDVVYPESAEDLISLTEIPISQTWQALEEVFDRGLCRNLGVANFNVPKLQSLVEGAKHRPQVNQVEMHPYLQQNALLDFCRSECIVITAYAPLGSAGRPEHLRLGDEPVLLQDPQIIAIAQEYSATPAQILLQWGIARGTAVIPKSVSPQRLKENLGASQLQLAPQSMTQINRLDRQRRYFDGRFWNFPEKGYTTEKLWNQ